ncbi:MAG: hypothetical protein WAW11_02975 [Patescibacteria group bacterium]
MNWKKVITYSAIGVGCVIGVLILMWLISLVFPMNIYLNIAIQAFLLAALLLIMLYQSTRTGTEKLIICSVTALVWLIAVYVFYGDQIFSGKSETTAEAEITTTQPANEELANANAQWANAIAERDNAKNELSYASEQIDSLQKALNKCKGVKEPLTPEEEIALLKRENAALRKGPKKFTLTAEPDVQETKFTGNFSKPAPTVTTENYDATGSSLPITEFEGDIKGDFWVTIDGQGHLLYALKASAWPITQAPKLNFENGPDFILDQQAGYWYYIDLSRLVSVQEINKYQYAVEWNVYIGQTNYGTGSYPTYLPHQSLKPLINKVRGKEWGEISDSDLALMHMENKNIWTPGVEGGFRPFRLDDKNGRAFGKEDRNLYQGWNFRNIIFAKRKTTIQ